MTPQNNRKPFYILDPMTAINHEAVARAMRDNLIREYEGGSISRSRFESAYDGSFTNGVFDFVKFKGLVRGTEYRMFSDVIVQKALQAAIDMQMQYGFDVHTIRSLQEQGNVSFLLTKQTIPELDQLQKGIIKLLKTNFKDQAVELKEDDWHFKKKVKENSLTLVQQTDKQTSAQKKLEFADVVQENGMGFAPKIITTSTAELVQFNTEQKTQKKVGERVAQAGLELFLLAPKSAELTASLPKEVRCISSLKDALLPRGMIEGRPPQPKMNA